jgi:hypothetical protein
MSYDGEVIGGWGSLARTQEQAHKSVQDLIDRAGMSHRSMLSVVTSQLVRA